MYKRVVLGMSAILKRRLEDALHAGRKIEKDQRSDQLLKGVVQGAALQISNERKVNVGDESGIYSIALNNNGTTAALGLGSGVLQLLNCGTFEKMRKLRTGLVYSVPLLAVKFYPCITINALYTGGSDGLVKAWNLDTFTHGEAIEESGNEITSLDFSYDGSSFATGGKDSCVRLYDSETLGLKRIYTGSKHSDMESGEATPLIPGHSQKVFSIKFHPDDINVFLSASWDHSLKVWDKRSNHAVRTIHGPFVCGDGLDIAHNQILTASWLAQDALQLWDYTSGSLIKSIKYPSVNHKGEFLYCARFWDKHNIVAAGSGTTDLKVINLPTEKVIATIDGDSHPVQAVEVKENKNILICGTSGNLLKSASLTDSYH